MNSSIWQRHDWRRFIRHDAHRFAPPSVQTKSFAARRIEQRQAEEQAALAAEQDAFHDDLVRIRWLVADLKFDLAWRRLCRKYGYNPNQPRVPGGNPDGGQWTSGGSGHSTAMDGRDQVHVSDSRILSDASTDPIRPGAQFAQTQVEIHTSALTGVEEIDRTTIALADRLGKVVDLTPEGSGPLYGTLVHAEFKASLLTDPIPNVTVEPTLGGSGVYGSKDSIRPDAVLRGPNGDIRAFYDVKTGVRGIDPPRAAEFRTFSASNVYVIELSVRRGVLLKSLR